MISDFWWGAMFGAACMWAAHGCILIVLWATFRYLFQPMKMGRKT
jgi:hypothetical protein